MLPPNATSPAFACDPSAGGTAWTMYNMTVDVTL